MPLPVALTFVVLLALTALELALVHAYVRAVALRPAGTPARDAWRALARSRGVGRFAASLPPAGVAHLHRARLLGRAMLAATAVLAAVVFVGFAR